MDSDSTLNSGGLMNTNNQLDSTLCIPENHGISSGNILNSTNGSVGVNLTSNLLEGALFIVSNGTYQNEDIPNCWQRPVDQLTHTFDNVAMLDGSQYFFHGLIKAYADLYNIDLHLIVYNDNKYIIIDKNMFFDSNKAPCNREKHAFILCNADNTTYSPLYINDVNGHILTVFKTDERFAWHCIEFFVNQVNQALHNTDQNQTEQHLNLPEEDLSRMAVDDTSLSTNNSTSSTTLQPETTLRASAFIKKILQQIAQLTDNMGPWLNNVSLESDISEYNISNLTQMSPQALAGLIQQRLGLISEVVQIAFEQIPQNNGTTIPADIVVEDNTHQGNIVQRNMTNDSVQTDPNSADVQPLTSTHLSNTTEVLQIPHIITPIKLPYEAPDILIQPKGKWHYRNMKDLGKKPIPLLAGNGKQRKLIRVKVPQFPFQGNHAMYLGVKIQTFDNREHRSKVLVPEHTNVNMDSFFNDNNLNRLQFNECSPTDYFDPVNKYVYLAVSSAEHQAQEKDIRIHMFNLYQSGSITREMIDNERLKQCKLAFWLCIFEDGVYKPISAPSMSCLIQEI